MIQSKVIITPYKQNILSMLIHDGQIEKIHVCNQDTDILSNIYVGKVKNIVKNINAAFVEIKPGILCYLSLDDTRDLHITNRKDNNVTLKEGDELLVQVIKEPVKTKDAVVSTELSLGGEYCAVSLCRSKTGKLLFSKKISKEQKELFSVLLKDSNPFDVIIRTKAAACNDIERIKQEIFDLSSELSDLISFADSRVCYSCVYNSKPGYLSFLEDLSFQDYERITTDDPEIYQVIKNTFKEQNEIINKLEFYQDSYSLSKLYSIETKITELLTKKVWLKSGANIVIENTEALTVIDVNTAKCIKKQDKENNVLKINMEAAEEIARQLSLRNISGIIIIDFINMKDEENIEKLSNFLKQKIKKDSVQTDFVDITPLGLVELTRRKIKKPLYEQLLQ